MKQLQLRRLSLLLASAALLAQPALAADGVVATVNGKDIPQARMDLILESQIPEEARKEDSEDLKKVKEEIRKGQESSDFNGIHPVYVSQLLAKSLERISGFINLALSISHLRMLYKSCNQIAAKHI